MSDLPITSDEGATPIVINDPVTTANVASVTSTNALQTVQLDGAKATYSASATGITSATTATDIFTIFGSSTKTIRVTHVEILFSTTAGGGVLDDLVIIKRSSANSGGTSASQTAVPHDSNDAAATATVLSYTANPTTLGAAVGTVRSLRIAALVVNSPESAFIWDFGDRPAQAIVLRGTAQGLCINLSSTTITGGIFSASVEWTEE